MFGKKYQKKVKRIEAKTDCSHHPESALKLILEDDWTASDRMDQSCFRDGGGLGIIPAAWLDYLSPRPRAAYETVRKACMLAIAGPYFGGRVIRNGLDGRKVDANWNNLDRKMEDITSYVCAQKCFEEAYTIEYPVSAALDKVVGLLAGSVIAPVGIIIGVFYTTEKVAQTRSKKVF